MGTPLAYIFYLYGLATIKEANFLLFLADAIAFSSTSRSLTFEKTSWLAGKL